MYLRIKDFVILISIQHILLRDIQCNKLVRSALSWPNKN